MIWLPVLNAQNFIEQQLQYPRVRAAKESSHRNILNLYQKQNISFPGKIFFRAFKSEQLLEVWAEVNTDSFKLVKTYDICAISGSLGPKRKQGDGQVPEGFYFIELFNPRSHYLLSLKINYPNESDEKISTHPDLGGDIFIHGRCVTIGCLPMTDEKIEEIYWWCVLAKNSGQSRIPVHIFPFRMEPEIFNRSAEMLNIPKPLAAFWSNLQIGYEYFEEKKKIPAVSVDPDGAYLFR